MFLPNSHFQKIILAKSEVNKRYMELVQFFSRHHRKGLNGWIYFRSFFVSREY